MGGHQIFHSTSCTVGMKQVFSYLDNDNKRKFACWFGPAEDYGGGDPMFLLPKSAKPIVRRTLTPEERDRRIVEIDQREDRG